MKTLNKISVIVLAVAFMFGFNGANITLAATTPSLGAAATYGILGSTYTNMTAGTTINGDVGFTTGPAVAPLGTLQIMAAAPHMLRQERIRAALYRL